MRLRVRIRSKARLKRQTVGDWAYTSIRLITPFELRILFLRTPRVAMREVESLVELRGFATR